MKTNDLTVFIAVTAAVLLTSASARASELDERIEATAQQSYVFRTYLKNDYIQTMSRDGVVTLTGTVDEEAHRTLAAETAASLPGVKSVDNQIRLTSRPVENDDGLISRHVQYSLLYHRYLSGINARVFVSEGVVTLQGEAESQAQKNLAGQYVKDIKGVKEVKNELTIAAKPGGSQQDVSEKIDDASITALLKLALLFHPSTSGFKTEVETRDGVVTLRGQATSGAGKDVASQVAKDVKGVTEVINNMIIVEESWSKG